MRRFWETGEQFLYIMSVMDWSLSYFSYHDNETWSILPIRLSNVVKLLSDGECLIIRDWLIL